MNIQDILQSLFEQHRQLLLFATVFLEQIGLPVPAYPSLIVAGAFPAVINEAGMLCRTLGVAVIACLIADIAWYWAGHRFGNALMHLICRLSMSPENCVVRSAGFYRRYGARTLLIAKFLPGAGAMTTLLAGTHGICLRKFIAYDAIGSMIWAGSGLLLGYAYQDTVSKIMGLLAPYVFYGAAVAALFATTVLLALWSRCRKAQAPLKLEPLMDISRLRQLLADKDT